MNNLIKFLFCLSFFTSILLAQTDADLDFNCAPVLADPEGDQAALGGLYKPAKNSEGEYLRALIVFVQFQGDNTAASDWTYGHLPGWAYSFIDPVTMTEYTDKTYSDFWNEMALGEFDFIGNVFPDLVTLPPEEDYALAGENFSHTNLDVLDIIDGWRPSKGPGTG